MKKSIIWVIIIIILVVIVIAVKRAPSTEQAVQGTFKVGAVLPLTGPSALWGESVKNGMDLALDGKTGLEVLYEDSKGAPADGISGFNLLQEKGVNLSLSALSAVSVPLSKIALEKKVPFFVTLVAASSTVIVNEYTSRYYADPAHYAGPSFTSDISPVKNAKRIAVLYRNDELGNSVRDEIKTLSAQYGKEVTYIDSFKPSETDFSTLISKVKASNAEVLVFVPATPGEGIAIVKTASRLKLTIPLVEAGAVFADLGNRKEVEGISFYSTSYEFSLDSDSSKEFRDKFKAKFNKEPNFGAAFGYDVFNLIDKCKDKGVGEKKDIRECIRAIPENDGIAGKATQVHPGDFVATMHLEKVN
jgi:branched-chain amino acid transport system substrate-binding protein